MELSIQERLKDLRVERGLTLEQLEEQVNLSKSALGSYETEDFKDISHYAIIKLAKFYGVNEEIMKYAKPGALVMHPGPVNRGVELTSSVIDGDSSKITEQVLNGVAVRMALLFLLARQNKEATK